MAGISGLSAFTALQGVDTPVPHGMQGRDPGEFGRGPVPGHEVPGDQSAASHELYQGTRYPGPIDADDRVETTPAAPGEQVDVTPDSHAAPYPRGISQDPVAEAAQRAALHGVDLGGPRRIIGVPVPYEETVSGGREDSPNASILAGGIPAQLRSGNDVDQGFGSTPGYGFAFGRFLRRVFHDAVPTDRTGTVRGERPFWGAHGLTPPRPYGTDSPYGDTPPYEGMQLRADRVTAPQPYVQPPNPEVAATTNYAGESGFAGGWMLG